MKKKEYNYSYENSYDLIILTVDFVYVFCISNK